MKACIYIWVWVYGYGIWVWVFGLVSWKPRIGVRGSGKAGSTIGDLEKQDRVKEIKQDALLGVTGLPLDWPKIQGDSNIEPRRFKCLISHDHDVCK